MTSTAHGVPAVEAGLVRDRRATGPQVPLARTFGMPVGTTSSSPGNSAESAARRLAVYAA
ncbi:hypothetical protein ACWLMY_05585 [Streptomyces anulatus]